jgi:UDP-glucose 4-epimerase
MSLPFQRAFVTGGAGFIASHVVDRLMRHGAEVVVYDNFSTGSQANLAAHLGNPRLRIVRGDVCDLPALAGAMVGAEAVFHFQANADVRGGVEKRRIDLEQNTLATWNVLECTVKAGAKTFVFASSATVYGEPVIFPTPEGHPLIQTSLYGASKLAGEAMIQAYSEYFGIRSFIFRFVSWVGERYSHGVVYDFVKKLQVRPTALNILGDGNQRKSYLHVIDGVEGIFTALQHARPMKNVFNLGHDEFTTVNRVAELVSEELGLTGVRYDRSTDLRGWLGDSPLVHLETVPLKALGWQPRIGIEDAIRRTVRFLTKKDGVTLPPLK